MSRTLLSTTLLICFVFFTCSRNTTAVKRSSQALQASLQAQENSLKLLDKMSEQSARASADGRVVASADSSIQTYVVSQRVTINTQQQELQQAIADVDAYTTGKSKKRERDVLNAVNTTVMKSAETLRILDKKTEVIVGFLNSETFSKSEIKTLFRPGDFTLNASQTKEGLKRFRPIVEKLFIFSEKYRQAARKLRGEIIVTGYSDATPVEPGSSLYLDLARRLQRDDRISEPTSSDLNKKLSELRAGTIRGLLETIIKTRTRDGGEPMDIQISVLGRGEELPRGTAASVPLNDPNRRVVTFYWVVLPEF